MPENHLRRRLAPMDAFFLYAETEDAPMNVGATLIFEGKMSFTRFKQHIASRLHLVPRYRQRVMPAPFNVNHPTWEDDPDFDIDNHVLRVKLDKPGTEEQLQQLKGRIFTGMLDRGKPLWEMYLVEGLTEQRTALILKVHHCMVDGVAGVSLAYLLLDATPEPPAKTRKPPFKPDPLPDATTRLVDAVWDNAIDEVLHWFRFRRNVKEFAERFDTAELRRAVKDYAYTMGNFLMPFSRMPFNAPFSGERLHVWREYPYAGVRAIRALSGATLNDVVLAVLGTTFREYLKDHPAGKQTKCQSLRVLVPVNVRREDERCAFGNRISFVPVEVPLNINDAMELLHAVHERMRELKESRVADSVSLMFDVLQGMPAPMQAMLAGAWADPALQSLLGQVVEIPPAHLICTNIPGPRFPLYMLGHRVSAMYAVVPTCLEMGVNCSVVSYDGKLFVSFVGDKRAGGTAIAKIMGHFDEKLREFCGAAEAKAAKYTEVTRTLQPEEDTHVYRPAVSSPVHGNGRRKSTRHRAVPRHPSRASHPVTKRNPRPRASI